MQSDGNIDKLAERWREQFTGELDSTPDAPPSQQTDEQIEARADSVKQWMRRQLSLETLIDTHSTFFLDVDGTVLTTKLAEAAAQALNVYYDDTDYVIPDVVFDWAFEVGEEWESQAE